MRIIARQATGTHPMHHCSIAIVPFELEASNIKGVEECDHMTKLLNIVTLHISDSV